MKDDLNALARKIQFYIDTIHFYDSCNGPTCTCFDEFDFEERWKYQEWLNRLADESTRQRLITLRGLMHQHALDEVAEEFGITP